MKKMIGLLFPAVGVAVTVWGGGDRRRGPARLSKGRRRGFGHRGVCGGKLDHAFDERRCLVASVSLSTAYGTSGLCCWRLGSRFLYSLMLRANCHRRSAGQGDRRTTVTLGPLLLVLIHSGPGSGSALTSVSWGKGLVVSVLFLSLH